MHVIPPSSEPLRLLQSYIQAVMRVGLPLATPEVRHLAVAHLHDLLALAIGAAGDGAALSKARGLSAARLQAVKADIIANLPRQDLSLGFISKRQRLSPRHIRRLFRAEGTTFTDFLLEQRLVRAHRMVADPHHGNWLVSTVAYECGFGDLSHFNHTFRRRFGATPTQHREGSRDESGC